LELLNVICPTTRSPSRVIVAGAVIPGEERKFAWAASPLGIPLDHRLLVPHEEPELLFHWLLNDPDRR
jgi:hypothetical protein